MKKRLLSAVLALVLCAYPAMAADFDTLTETDTNRFIRTEWTQLVPLPTDDLHMFSLTLINASGEQRPLFTFPHPVTYLTLPSIV